METNTPDQLVVRPERNPKVTTGYKVISTNVQQVGLFLEGDANVVFLILDSKHQGDDSFAITLLP
jgi:hypothetical protein